MTKWFDKMGNEKSSIIYSRIRLTRNLDEYVFPSRLTKTECGEMVERLQEGLEGLGQTDGHQYQYKRLDGCD